MVTKSYFRLILFTILIFFSNPLLYCMDNKNIELGLEKAQQLNCFMPMRVEGWELGPCDFQSRNPISELRVV